MAAPPEPAPTEHEQAQKARLEKEREEPFHGQRLANHAARVLRERRPVRAELEFHGDAGHDTHGEIDAEDPDPEARGVVPSRVAAPEARGFHHDDKQRQPHRQLREQVVVDDGEGELQPMPDERVAHWKSPAGSLYCNYGGRSTRSARITKITSPLCLRAASDGIYAD